MTEVAAPEEAEQPKKGKKGLIMGVIGAIILGGAGYFVTSTGIFPPASGESTSETEFHDTPSDSGHGAISGDQTTDVKTGVTFVELDQLTISLGKFASSRHLRFQAYLEVEPAMAEEVKHLSPRILDVLNTYLRAIAETELEDPASMNTLRAQMLRRVQVVVGEENVRDLLITEFVLN